MTARIAVLALAGLASGCSCEDAIVGPETEEPPVEDRGQWLTTGVLSDGTPVAAWYNRDHTSLEFGIATPAAEGFAWSYEPVDGWPDDAGLDVGDRGRYASLSVAPGNVVWIAYHDASNRSLRWARRDWEVAREAGDDFTPPVRGRWTTGVADVGGGPTPDAGLWASLAIDPAGHPVVAHHDRGQGTLRVVRWSDGAFGAATVIEGEDRPAQDSGDAAATAEVGAFARLDVAADGTERVLYYDAAFGALRLAEGGASGFTVSTVDDEGDVGPWPSLLVEDGGTLHVAYQDVGHQDLLYATGTAGSFTRTVVDAGEYRGADTEIFRDGGLLSILYFDGEDNDVLLATLSGGSWTTATLGGEDRALGYHNEVFASGGRTWAACYDYTARSVWARSLE